MGGGLAAKLPAAFLAKTLFLSSVTLGDAWYANKEDCYVKPPTREKRGQSAVAGTMVGNGRLGYIGDVSSEPGSDAVVMAMCGF